MWRLFPAEAKTDANEDGSQFRFQVEGVSQRADSSWETHREETPVSSAN
jgi:hypothetical protein